MIPCDIPPNPFLMCRYRDSTLTRVLEEAVLIRRGGRHGPVMLSVYLWYNIYLFIFCLNETNETTCFSNLMSLQPAPCILLVRVREHVNWTVCLLYEKNKCWSQLVVWSSSHSHPQRVLFFSTPRAQGMLFWAVHMRVLECGYSKAARVCIHLFCLRKPYEIEGN